MLGDTSIPPSTLEQPLVLEALAVLLRCCGFISDVLETNDAEQWKKPCRTLKPLEISNYMRLDAACVRGLDLLPVMNREFDHLVSGNQKHSLYGILNRTKTAMGSRLLKKWLLMPLQNVDEINRRQNVVENFIQNAIFRTELRDSKYAIVVCVVKEMLNWETCVYTGHLKLIPDVARLCRRFQKLKNVSLQQVVRLYQLSIRIPLLLNCFSQYASKEDSDPLKPYWQRLNGLHKELERFEVRISLSISSKVFIGCICFRNWLKPLSIWIWCKTMNL